MFRVIIRVVFLFAYAAFLYASLRHIAYFFSSFEPAGTDGTGAYALAISIDVTALILTIGVMFFKRGMPGHAIIGVWFFIVCLTGFSWLVNWEYAVQFQSVDLNRATAFQWVNPILASSFAFLNLAYSVIAELFSSKPKTAEELQQELAELQQKSGLKQQLSEIKNQQLFSWIVGKKQLLSEALSQQKLPESAPTFETKEPELFSESEPQPEEISEEKSEPDIARKAQAPRKYVLTFEEASEYTGYAISTLKQQLEKGEIQATSSGKLLISSLKIKSGNTGKIVAIKSVEKGA